MGAAWVSRQPRLPQWQIAPCSSTMVWPISPAAPPHAAVELSGEEQAGADSRRQHHDRRGRRRRGRRRSGPRRARRGSRRCPCARAAEPLAHGRRRMDGPPAGKDGGGSDRPGGLWIGADSAMPTPSTAPERHAALLDGLVHQPLRDGERAGGVVVDVEALPASRRGRCRRDRRRPRAGRRARSRCRRPPPRRVEREQDRAAGRPAGALGGPCSPRRSTTRPVVWRSATRFDTVVRDSPVRREISARLAVPRCLRMSITARRLRSRKDPNEPFGTYCTAAILSTEGGVCQGFGKNTPQRSTICPCPAQSSPSRPSCSTSTGR